ncbi:glycoside hydrolase family 13 protein [Calocera cornea HHB12733]|uniref:Glycoside hydrolase family 13 protein n=1 Tax=Calocera cornea HHB12733 TaxID=1353952 RepID=A0A165IGV6_9BASI|nr:glycoside hydrolase family 13 protein [Calocera cornea HHB12733]
MAAKDMPGGSITMHSVETDPAWWKEAIVYQIYPHSFADSNGDGVGDIPGIISHLDHLADLGVDVVWLSPVYPSPGKDMGYDIADYRGVNALYGTMEDFERMLREMHKRGIKLMMDLVVNHTSSEHPWFLSSRSSRSSPKRDWYIWRPPRFSPQGARLPPNNWMSSFRGSSAWTWDDATGEYYLRVFTEEQPDLNWENEEVRKAVYEDMRFWLDKGVDGLRMDVINMISKPPGFPDAVITEPGRFLQPAWSAFTNGPRVHEFIKEMHREVLSKYDLITVGETPFTHDVDTLVKYVLPEEKELQMIFTFELHDVDGVPRIPLKPRPFHLRDFKSVIDKYQTRVLEAGGWNSVYLENHDQARSVSRFGSGEEGGSEGRERSAKMLACCHCTLSGTAYVYQGEEIGMVNMPREWGLEEYKDVKTRLYWNEVLNPRETEANPNPDMSDILSDLAHKARDHARLPMQWDDSPNAGFAPAGATPWMRVHEDYREWNAKEQRGREGSVFGFWKRMIAFRKMSPACTYGHFHQLAPDHPQIFAYRKLHRCQRLTVILNFSSTPTLWRLPEELASAASTHKIVMGNYEDAVKIDKDRWVEMRPWEAVVWEEDGLPN